MPRPAHVASKFVPGVGQLFGSTLNVQTDHLTPTRKRHACNEAYYDALDGTRPDRYGVFLDAVEDTPPIREKFPPGAEGDALYNAHMDALSIRLLAGEGNKQVFDRDLAPAPARSRKPTVGRAVLPACDGARMSWDDLVTVPCAACRRELLGAKHEHLRRIARERNMKCLARLPARIAGRRAGRPLCHGCLIELRRLDAVAALGRSRKERQRRLKAVPAFGELPAVDWSRPQWGEDQVQTLPQPGEDQCQRA